MTGVPLPTVSVASTAQPELIRWTEGLFIDCFPLRWPGQLFLRSFHYTRPRLLALTAKGRIEGNQPQSYLFHPQHLPDLDAIAAGFLRPVERTVRALHQRVDVDLSLFARDHADADREWNRLDTPRMLEVLPFVALP